MVLLHGGGPGVEKIAASWAEARGVDQLVCRPDWNAHGKAAPFRRNDELLNLLPKGVIAFPGSGITGNLVDKARQLGIPVYEHRRLMRRTPTTSEPVPRLPRRIGSAPFLLRVPVSRIAARRFAPAPLALSSTPRAPSRRPHFASRPGAAHRRRTLRLRRANLSRRDNGVATSQPQSRTSTGDPLPSAPADDRCRAIGLCSDSLASPVWSRTAAR